MQLRRSPFSIGPLRVKWPLSWLFDYGCGVFESAKILNCSDRQFMSILLTSDMKPTLAHAQSALLLPDSIGRKKWSVDALRLLVVRLIVAAGIVPRWATTRWLGEEQKSHCGRLRNVHGGTGCVGGDEANKRMWYGESSTLDNSGKDTALLIGDIWWPR